LYKKNNVILLKQEKPHPPSPKFIFAHQGKTGGTTIVKLLRNHFGDERCYSDWERAQRWNLHPVHRRVANWLDPFRSYRRLEDHIVIHGHFDPRKYRRAFPDAVYMTMFRDPIQQLVSLYSFWKSDDNKVMSANPYRKILLEQNLDLIGFAELMRPWFTSQCHAFQPEEFDFIGITEHFGSALLLLKKCFIPELNINDLVVFRANAGKPVGELYKLDEMTKMRLEGLLGQKIALYERALQCFEKNCRDRLGDGSVVA